MKQSVKRPRWRKVLSDLWENRMRTLLVVASITVGVFAIGMLTASYFIIAEDMEATYSAANPANIEIVMNPFQADFLDTVERIPGVRQAEGRHRLTLRISQDNGETWRGLDVIAMEDFDEAEIFLRETIEGEPAPQKREIVIETRLRNDVDVAVGDTLIVQLADGTQKAMPVVGFVQDQGIESRPGSPAVAYVTLDTLASLGQQPSFNRLLVTVEGDSNDEEWITAVSTLVEDKVERQGSPVYRTTINKTNEHPEETTVLAVLTLLGAMGALMLLLGSSLIANTLTALLNQHMRQIGVMKLVGAVSNQIRGMYLLLILAFSLLALAVSIPVSGIAGYRFAIFIADQLNVTIQGYRFIPSSIIVQLLIAVIVPLVAGFLPVRSGSRMSVQDAISDGDGAEAGGEESWLDRLGETAEWISRPLLIAIRNTFRQKKRLALTLFTLTMAGAIFIAVFNLRTSLNEFIGSISNLFIADLTVDVDRPYRQAKIEQALTGIDGIERIEGWLQTVGEIEHLDGSDEEVVSITAAPAGSDLLLPPMLEGRMLQAGDQRAIVIADTIWEAFPGVGPGDTLPLAIDGKQPKEWTIVGIFAFPGRGADIVVAYAPYESIAPEINRLHQATAFKLVTTNHSFEAQDAVGQVVDRRLQDLGFKVNKVEPGKTTTQGISDGINILVSFFLAMAGLTAVVGSIGLAGTMSMNVLERTREIGIMRAIGAVDSEVTKSVIVEGLMIGTISWLFGIVLSFPISYALLYLVSISITNSLLPLHFSPTGFWLWLIVVLILAALASIIPARNAARLTIREVLAYE